MNKKELKERHEENKRKVQSLGKTRLIILAILAIGTICSFVFYDYIFGGKCVFDDVPHPVTDSDFVNDCLALVPRIIRCIQIITITLVIITVILAIVRKIFFKTQRGITVGGLICNLIRWLTAIVLVIVVLAVWGVNTGALITGAGVITLVVGLGMQSLIADVVAGLFIVFENEFNVGDWITVGDFRGQVISIGIRTTKLEALGNIKILNNNSIQGVLNHTVKPSVAKTLIDIEYGADLPKIEKVIRDHLKDLNVPGSIGEISYDGVATLGASGVTLQFTVGCYEGDIFAVERAMNREVKVMFDKNGIDIPFPQVVVHKEGK